MMKRLQHHLLAAVVTFLVSSWAMAEVVVVVSAKAGVDQLSQDEVINIFLGRHRKLPTGQIAYPYDLPSSDKLRSDFYRKLVDKNPAEINAYWSRLHFSGKANPPELSPSPQELLKTVSSLPGAIGYLDRSQIDARVRVVFSLD